jgi:hypothetical protein
LGLQGSAEALLREGEHPLVPMDEGIQTGEVQGLQVIQAEVRVEVQRKVYILADLLQLGMLVRNTLGPCSPRFAAFSYFFFPVIVEYHQMMRLKVIPEQEPDVFSFRFIVTIKEITISLKLFYLLAGDALPANVAFWSVLTVHIRA